ncbi:MAG: hypothetical protein ACE5J3_04630 [Methanosarcinales archaeon]
MDHKTLLENWETKNKYKTIRLEELKDSAVSKDRIKKNYALWVKGDKKNETKYQTFSIWVLNPNTKDEIAYFENTEPLYISPPLSTKSLRELTIEYINKQSILGAIVESVDEALNTVIAKVYIDGTTTKKWLLRKNKLGNIEHLEVV